MNPIQTYRDLEVWQFGMTLVERCYNETKRFPVDERYGLTAQLRRAAVSIPANVAEGACRHTTSVYVNHVSIAHRARFARRTRNMRRDRMSAWLSLRGNKACAV